MLRTIDDRQDRHREDPEEVRDRDRVGEAGGAADRGNVQDDDADDLGEAERDDGQVVAPEAQRRDADDEPGHRCGQRARHARLIDHHQRRSGGVVQRAADERGDRRRP